MTDRRSVLRGMAALSAAAIPASAMALGIKKAGPASKRLATIEELAAMDFSPLHHGRDFDILTREEWSALYEHYIVASNVAAKLLADTKPEMVERVRPWMDEEDFSLLTTLRSVLDDAASMLKTLQEPIIAAGTRLLCCACAVEIEIEEGSRDA